MGYQVYYKVGKLSISPQVKALPSLTKRLLLRVNQKGQMMNHLNQAQALFKEHLTIESLRHLDKLEKLTSGEEADQIGELWEVVMADADEAVLEQAREEGLI